MSSSSHIFVYWFLVDSHQKTKISTVNFLCLLFAEKINFLLVNQQNIFSVQTGFEELKKKTWRQIFWSFGSYLPKTKIRKYEIGGEFIFGSFLAIWNHCAAAALIRRDLLGNFTEEPVRPLWPSLVQAASTAYYYILPLSAVPTAKSTAADITASACRREERLRHTVRFDEFFHYWFFFKLKSKRFRKIAWIQCHKLHLQ